MSLIPPNKKLKTMYKEVMENEAVTTVSRWVEPNFDDACDDEEYLQRGVANADAMQDNFKKALDIITKT